jgi:L-2-hydroxyglutarate oxidase LhgO
MEKINILIIGAGVVGLAIAERLSENHESVVLADKENSFGQHASSRNSEVIHSGIYYKNNSLKADLCVEGNGLLYDYFDRENIEYNNCGKYVIAANKDEIDLIEELYENGKRNDVRNMSLATKHQINEEIPEIKALMGLFVPSTGIMDSHSFMKRLEYKAENNGTMISYNTEVTGIEKSGTGYTVRFADGYSIEASVVINSAGLFSDRVAELAGIDPDTEGYKIHYCKGVYYRTPRYRNFKRIVYPVPAPEVNHLGIHIRIHLDGSTAFGPNSFYVDELDYSFDSSFKKEFHSSIKKYIDIDPEDLKEDDCGIRPKLQIKGESFRDFIIKNESDRGLDNFINLVGIESPGLTSSLAIAKYVEKLI